MNIPRVAKDSIFADKYKSEAVDGQSKSSETSHTASDIQVKIFNSLHEYCLHTINYRYLEDFYLKIPFDIKVNSEN